MQALTVKSTLFPTTTQVSNDSGAQGRGQGWREIWNQQPASKRETDREKGVSSRELRQRWGEPVRVLHTKELRNRSRHRSSPLVFTPEALHHPRSPLTTHHALPASTATLPGPRSRRTLHPELSEHLIPETQLDPGCRSMKTIQT